MLNLFAHYMFEATRISSSTYAVQRDLPASQVSPDHHGKGGRPLCLDRTSAVRHLKGKVTCAEN
jgi:hypothetical protein